MPPTSKMDGYFANQAIRILMPDKVRKVAIGQEEMKIRTDPAARVTELLKTVFGGR